MITGLLTVQISVFDAMTLKDKRSVIKSLKDRIGNKYNVSIAEVGDNDKIRSSLIGIAMVANDSRFVHQALDTIVQFVRKQTNLTLIDYYIETV
ncbi:MAG: DUF503 domain-containing protein [Phycisphaerae bacterium]|nr:DUF503 domain-containing protein [Phycisphaerae bacterium]